MGGGAEAGAQRRIGAQAGEGGGEGGGVARGHQEGADAVAPAPRGRPACRRSPIARPAAIACQTLFGTTRAALSLVPKTPRQIAAAPTSAPERLVGDPALPGEARRAVAGQLALEPGPELAVADQAHRRHAGARGRPRAPWRRRGAGRACRRRATAAGPRAAAADGKRSGSAPTGTTAMRARSTPKRRASQSAPARGVGEHQVGQAQGECGRCPPARPRRRGRPSRGRRRACRRARSSCPRPGARGGRAPRTRPGGRRAGPGSRPRPRPPGARAGPARGEAGPGARRSAPPRRRAAGAQAAPVLSRRRSQTGRWCSTTSTPSSRRPDDQHPGPRVVPVVGAEPHHPHGGLPGLLSGGRAPPATAPPRPGGAGGTAGSSRSPGRS